MSPPPPISKNYMKNRIKKSVRIFVYKNLTQIVLLFSKCLAFCILKHNVMQSVRFFEYIYMAMKRKSLKLRDVKCLAFFE